MKTVLHIGIGAIIMYFLCCRETTDDKRKKLLLIVDANSVQYPGYRQVIINASPAEIDRLYEMITKYLTIEQVPRDSTIYEDLLGILRKYGIIYDR